MFEFLTKLRKKLNTDTEIFADPAVIAAIASPKQEAKFVHKDNYTKQQITAKIDSATYQPIDVVSPDQSIPGKFDYHSATWKYLQHYFDTRIIKLHKSNESPKLSIDRTQLIRGQIKEIKLLLQHINQLAGVDSSPINTSLSVVPTDKGQNYE